MNTRLINQLRWAFSFTKGYRGALLAYFVLELMAIVLSLLFVYWSKMAIDNAISNETSSLQPLLFLVVCSVVVGIVLRSCARWINERTRHRISIYLQNDMIENQMRSIWQVVKDWHSGDVQVRIHSDSKEVVDMVVYASISFILTLIKLIASFAFLWSMDPMLALIIVAISPLFLFSKLYFRKMRRLSSAIKAKESHFGKVLQENLRFRMLIRGMGLLEGRRAKLEDSQNQIYHLKMEQLNFSTLTQSGVKATINAGYLIAFIWGVYRLQAGEISFGTMTAFLQLVGRVQSPILTLIGFAPIFIRFRTSVDRLMELSRSEKEPLMQAEKIKDLKALRIENLSFKYDNYNVLDNLNLYVKVSESVAIVGSSGKGKTTLIRLLLTLLTPQSGKIWMESGQGKSNLTLGHRVNFSYVPQGNTLFSGTIRENLEMGIKIASPKQIEYALWLACAEFVWELPEGIDTLVGESGHGLSEGQAQRISIARAMMQDRAIWIFDEVTSALDNETASLLTDRIMHEGKDKICIFVTHDLNLVHKCNKTIVLEK